jgi:hypothetical protein
MFDVSDVAGACVCAPAAFNKKDSTQIAVRKALENARFQNSRKLNNTQNNIPSSS